MRSWWDVTSIYQIYPRSFQDTNGDGIGDIQGIISRLDYICELGIDAVWISPMYMSPQADCGYDISDYRSIDPMFGTMDDMKQLIEEAHTRNLKIMMDYIPNHTSIAHEWFRQARSSRTNPYRDFYVWREPVNGREPTNWISLAGGRAWTYDEPTGQYYLHSFMPDQPDLNWDNPRVRDVMHDVLRYWCDLGVDGFRVDAEWPISKIYRDDTLSPNGDPDEESYGHYLHDACKNGPHMLRYMREMTDVIAAYRDKFMVFEYYTDENLRDELQEYIDIFALNPRVASPFVFDMFRQPMHAHNRAARMAELYARLPHGSRPVHALGNHDQSRIASRVGIDQASALAVMELALPGIPTIYYGEEIGMRDYEVPVDERKDNFVEGGGMGGRDPERTPMRWDDSAGSGFTTGVPWLPIGSRLATCNVARQHHDPRSVWTLYYQLLQLRRDNAVLRHGRYNPLDTQSGYVWAFEVTHEGERMVAAMNFADQAQMITIPDVTRIIISSDRHPRAVVQNHIMLGAYEAIICR